MPEPLSVFILAGEPSGDAIAADLVARLRARADVQLSGVGGSALAKQGLTSMFPMSELSVMGWADVLPRLPWLLWRARQVARAILAARPDVAVLVDAQEFSRIVAGQVRSADPRIPLMLYVAPAVWAWKPERAAKLKPLFDEVLSVLPFEPAVMARLGGPPTSYVGHPALDRFARPDVPPSRGPLLLLPGSRAGELRRHLPLMREIVRRFAAHPAIDGFALPTPGHLAERVRGEIAGWPAQVTVAVEDDARRDAFANAVAAVAVTGTVTLELALAGVPMVATYVADRGQSRQWAKYANRFAALPNILLDRPLVPEVLGLARDADAVGSALDDLLAPSGDAAETQRRGFAEIRAMMERGAPGAPLTDAAERVLALARPSGR